MRALAVLVLAAASFVIACGSSDDTTTGAVAAGGSSAAGSGQAGSGQAGAAAGQAGAAAGQAGAAAGQAGAAAGQGGSGTAGTTAAFACVAGGDCVPGEQCAKDVGSAPGESLEFCQCPTTKPSTPVSFACGMPFPKGQSAFVCYDPAGETCKVPGAEVIQLLGDRIPTACANLVSAGANTVKTSAGAGPLCCYMFSFTGCK